EVFNEYLTDDEFIHVIYCIEESVNKINNAANDPNNSVNERNNNKNFPKHQMEEENLIPQRIRKEILLIKRKNKRIRKENLLLRQENERVKNEILLLKQEKEQTKNDNKVPKPINRTNFTNSEYSKKQKFKNNPEKRRIVADSEIKRLLSKLNSIDLLLANIWCQFIKNN
ncbi:8473_t:CDS:1, partial [Gigaspora margarita]